ncbi:MAG: hypothetical protein B6D63_00160 [Candidatus Latescibacteria bacterium 4484_7]|nr:MAG: hypothetical protein B6D63_00160 [Candidatus Latescibacteria bacterium 4484_7]
MNSDLKEWFNGKGEEFLREIGVKEGDVVLDVGCGGGSYSIPAARLVGKSGAVYAVDKNREALDTLSNRAKAEGIDNIILVNMLFPDEAAEDLREGVEIHAESREGVEIHAESIDVALIYDVLHYLDKEERDALYRKVFKLLRKSGILSVYPKHSRIDWPLWHLAGLDPEDIAKEIEKNHFYLTRTVNNDLIHDESCNRGTVLIFGK